MSKEILIAAVEGDMPEHISATFESTGPQGGDSGHGGEASLEFRIESGDYSIAVEDGKGNILYAFEDYGEGRVVRITARGDWELGSLGDALIELGRQLGVK